MREPIAAVSRRLAFVDTQVLSYEYAGKRSGLEEGLRISSVAAKEFLHAYRRDDPTQAEFYLPIRLPAVRSPSPAAFGDLVRGVAGLRGQRLFEHQSDAILLDFGADFPAVVETSNVAIAHAINQGRAGLFRAATAHVPKARRKALVRRFRFLVRRQVICVPVSNAAVELAMTLLATFAQDHNLKEDFRNSLNDVLILSAAAVEGAKLLSFDRELRRFASSLQAKVGTNADLLAFDFATEVVKRADTRESRGYINRGWAFQVRSGRQSSVRG